MSFILGFAAGYALCYFCGNFIKEAIATILKKKDAP